MLTYVFRVDASINMGSGHVMRCLTLAKGLCHKTIKVIFICRQFPGHMCQFIEEKGYEVYRLPCCAEELHDKADERSIWLGTTWQIDAEQTIQILQELSAKSTIQWLIVDHYSLDIRWEQRMKSYVQKIMVIDDLADRHHDCNLLLDQNLYTDMQIRYNGLLPGSCQTLLGPQYAILRSEFYEARKKVKVRDGIVKRILIFFGGSDPTNETTKALHAIQLLYRYDIYVDVIVGDINPHKEQIKKLCNVMCNTTFHCQINNMAEVMASADLAIGAGGTATWERSFLGLPAIILIIANNQRETTDAVAQAGVVINLGWHTDVSSVDIYENLVYILQSCEVLREMSKKSLRLSDMKSSVTVMDYIYNNESIINI